MQIKETELPNKLRVITATIPEFQSGAVGAFVNRGSRHETEANNGIAHFLEHMVFKGTDTRSCFDISHMIEVDGSYLNAHTSTSHTAYYARGLAEHMPTAIDIIGDALTNSKFDAADIAIESGVVLQEINQYKDDPSSVMYELLMATAYPNQPVGRTILGNPEFVANAKGDDFRSFIQQNYSAETVVVFAAGGIDHDAIVEASAKSFDRLPTKTDLPPTIPAIYDGGFGIDMSKDFAQVNIGIMFPSVPIIDSSVYAHLLLADVLAGGMSSPLFVEIREKRGLVYHVSANCSFDLDHGNFAIYGGMTSENVNDFIKVSCHELAKLRDSINEIDLTRAKNGRLVGIAMVQESPGAMIEHMAQSLFTRGRIRDFGEIRRDIERVTIDDICQAAKQLLNGKPAISMVGPVPDGNYLDMVKAAAA